MIQLANSGIDKNAIKDSLNFDSVWVVISEIEMMIKAQIPIKA